MSPIDTRIVDDITSLEEIVEEWDGLAVAARAPFASPHWLLPWWRHAAPPRAQLAVVIVRDAGTLIGVAPYFIEADKLGLRRCRTLGAGASLYVEPIAVDGREGDAAGAIAEALTRLAPDYLYFDGVYEASGWRDLIARRWNGGRSWWHAPLKMPAPFVDAGARSHEEWFGSKSKNFREQTRRRRRQLEKKGAEFRRSSADRFESDLAEFAVLHEARWDPRGGSSVLTDGVKKMLPEAGRALGEERFRLWSIDVDGRSISSHLFVEAGGESAYWLGGFDPEWSQQQPALQTLIAAIEDGWKRGDRRIDLGAGGQDYKYRLSDGEVQVVWGILVPRSPRMWLVRARFAPFHLKRAVLNRMPEDVKERVRKVLRRDG